MASHNNRQTYQERAGEAETTISCGLPEDTPLELWQEGDEKHSGENALEFGKVLPRGRVKVDEKVWKHSRCGSYECKFDKNGIARLERTQKILQSADFVKSSPHPKKQPYPRKIKNEKIRYPFGSNSVE